MISPMAAALPPGPRLPYALQTLLVWQFTGPFLRWCRRRYGPTFTVRSYPAQAAIHITDPADLKAAFAADPDVLRAGEANAILGPVLGHRSVLLADGDEHLRRRRLMLPHFHGESVKRYASVVGEIADEEIARLPEGKPVRLHKHMQAITLEVIMRAVIGIEDPERLARFRVALRRIVEFAPGVLLMWVWPKLGAFGPWKRQLQWQAEAEALLLEEIALRRQAPNLAERTDVLSLLIGAHHDDGTQMDDGELRDQLLTMLLAGHETTATGLAWAFERLARHPEVMAEARRAAREGDDDYLDAVIKETLRVRPVIPDVARVVAKPITLGGYDLPAGVTVMPQIALVHWGDAYPDADVFRPERWLGDEQPPSLAWLPFGGGRRRCLGAAFASLEMRIVSAARAHAGHADRTERPRRMVAAAAHHARTAARRTAYSAPSVSEADETETGAALAKATRRRISVALTCANVTGGVVVWVFLTYVLPTRVGYAPAWVNDIVFAAYLPIAVVAGWWWGVRQVAELTESLQADGPIAARERSIALRLPTRLTGVHAVLWGGGIVLFSAINFTYSGRAGWTVAVTVLLAGLMTTTVAYLLSEQLMRPVTQRVLAGEPSTEPLPGVRARLLLAWSLGTGAPMLGILLVCGQVIGSSRFSVERLAVTVGFLGAIGLGVGMVSLHLVARSISQPLASLREALERVRGGDTSVEVAVDDSSEVGLLQAGFNQMVAGLHERERLQDLFGRHVGEDVARQALEGGVRLGGEVREAAVLFIDITGSTKLVSTRSPTDVVELLNRFFGVVVETVAEYGGWVNKFEGDAALCIFGAPLAQEDPAGCALAAGCALYERLASEVPELEAGIGLSAGPVVAGNVGAAQRYEYTVIGEPVNEAARLTELAKTRAEGRILASEAIVQRASPERARRWRAAEEVQLRGLAEPTRLAVPVAA